WRQQQTCGNDGDKGDGSTDPHVGTVDGKEGDSSWPWPFVCVPIYCGSSRLGVLGVDGWSRVGLGRPQEETHPEPGALAFLREAGVLLGGTLFAERRAGVEAALSAALRSKDATIEGALETLVVLLRAAVSFRASVHVLETHAATPGLVFRRAAWGEWEGA
ncbi:unnamed protein product, partial [Discosporangium mesarthrocarpum]